MLSLAPRLPDCLLAYTYHIERLGMGPREWRLATKHKLKQDLQIVNGEVAAYEVARSIFVAESDDGAAGTTDRLNPGTLGYAVDSRHHFVEADGIVGCITLPMSSRLGGSWATPLTTAARLNLISNGRTRHVMTTGGQRWASSGWRGQRLASRQEGVG